MSLLNRMNLCRRINTSGVRASPCFIGMLTTNYPVGTSSATREQENVKYGLDRHNYFMKSYLCPQNHEKVVVMLWHFDTLGMFFEHKSILKLLVRSLNKRQTFTQFKITTTCHNNTTVFTLHPALVQIDPHRSISNPPPRFLSYKNSGECCWGSWR